MAMKIGVIGDDFTGASDAANTLARAGARTLQYAGVPEGAVEGGIDAAVIALKTRSAPVRDAVAQSLAACRWLVANGAAQVAFKYCSTFDSTREGNIGPVAEALLGGARRRRWRWSARRFRPPGGRSTRGISSCTTGS